MAVQLQLVEKCRAAFELQSHSSPSRINSRNPKFEKNVFEEITEILFVNILRDPLLSRN